MRTAWISTTPVRASWQSFVRRDFILSSSKYASYRSISICALSAAASKGFRGVRQVRLSTDELTKHRMLTYQSEMLMLSFGTLAIPAWLFVFGVVQCRQLSLGAPTPN